MGRGRQTSWPVLALLFLDTSHASAPEVNVRKSEQTSAV